MTGITNGMAGRTAPASVPVGTIPTDLPGLLLRPARWPEEASALVQVNNAMRTAGGSLAVMTLEGLRAYYDHLENSDLATDLRIGEVDGRPVAYVRVEWRDEHRGDRVFGTAIFRTPDAPAGTFAALLDWALARHRSNAATVPADGRPAIVTAITWGDDAEGEAELRARGFENVRFGYEMLRSTLDDIPDRPLPAGVEVRPVEPGSAAGDLRRGGRGLRRPLGRRRRGRLRHALAGVPGGPVQPGHRALAGGLGR